MRTVSCSDCGTILSEDQNTPVEQRKPCPNCGSKARTIHIEVTESIAVKVHERLDAKHRDLRGEVVRELRQGDDLYRKTGKWNKLTRLIDRLGDRYMKKIEDGETGKIIHHCDEPLSEHRGHGSAKFKKAKKRH